VYRCTRLPAAKAIVADTAAGCRPRPRGCWRRCRTGLTGSRPPTTPAWRTDALVRARGTCVLNAPAWRQLLTPWGAVCAGSRRAALVHQATSSASTTASASPSDARGRDRDGVDFVAVVLVGGATSPVARRACLTRAAPPGVCDLPCRSLGSMLLDG